MNQLNFSHQTQYTPPRRFLPVIESLKTIYKNWIIIHRNMPRVERFGIGLKIDLLFLDSLELLRKAAFTSINQKIVILDEALGKIDSLKFFIQLAWEAKLISNNQFSSLGILIENIGKMVGGWKKGLITKTSARVAEERKE